jgi:hypothetical protein
MTKVNTLVPSLIGGDRGSGRTTRQVDFAIQELFKGHIVEVRDHWEDGNNKVANRMLLDKIIERLQNEHGKYIVKVDMKSLTIELAK